MPLSQKDHLPKTRLFERVNFVLLGVLVMLLVVALDQLSKLWLRTSVVPMPTSLVRVLPIFDLNHAWNKGVSFSLFRADDDSRRWALVAMALALSAVVAWWLRSATTWLSAVAYGLILGGALGNVCDRVVHGAVFDFLQFHLAGYYWPSFNLADSAIFVGVSLLLWEGWAQSRRQRSGE